MRDCPVLAALKNLRIKLGYLYLHIDLGQYRKMRIPCSCPATRQEAVLLMHRGTAYLYCRGNK